KWAAVRLVTTRDRTRNADELGPHLVAREPNRRITMPSKIDELEMRGKLWVRQRARALQIEVLGIVETSPDAVPEQHVEGPVRLCRAGAVGEEERPKRMVPWKIVLICFHSPRARQRGADKA